MPFLESLHAELSGQGLRVPAVSIDDPAAGEELRRVVREARIGFTVLWDPQRRIERLLRLVAVPETFSIDRRGLLCPCGFH